MRRGSTIISDDTFQVRCPPLQPLSTRHTTCNNLSLRLVQNIGQATCTEVLANLYLAPHLPEFVQHEITLHGTTMYDHRDYARMIELMADKKIRIDGMITHRFKLNDIPNVFEKFSTSAEPYFKIMLDIAEN